MLGGPGPDDRVGLAEGRLDEGLVVGVIELAGLPDLGVVKGVLQRGLLIWAGPTVNQSIGMRSDKSTNQHQASTGIGHSMPHGAGGRGWGLGLGLGWGCETAGERRIVIEIDRNGSKWIEMDRKMPFLIEMDRNGVRGCGTWWVADRMVTM